MNGLSVPGQPAGSLPLIEAVFDRYDKDRDGTLSVAELKPTWALTCG